MFLLSKYILHVYIYTVYIQVENRERETKIKDCQNI